MHFVATYAYVGAAVEHPAAFYQNNVAGTLAVLETVRRHGVTQIVFSSSCATYGIPQTTPISEDHPQNPISPYGASELMGERMLADFSVAYDLRYVSLRYFNAAGADPDGEIGEVHASEIHLIPLVLEAAVGRRAYITVYGTDYETPDGTCIRGFIHVTDLAEAHVLALDAVRNEAPPISYNLGTSNGFSVREVIQTACSVTGCTISVREGDRRPGDPAWRSMQAAPETTSAGSASITICRRLCERRGIAFAKSLSLCGPETRSSCHSDDPGV
jgi:UDP-glucose-4-epimerase GalE